MAQAKRNEPGQHGVSTRLLLPRFSVYAMRIALAQVNPTVGDLRGNAALILDYAQRAKAQAADLVVFPELVLTGYPPMDLLDMAAFLDETDQALARLVAELPKDLGVILGVPLRNEGPHGKRLLNAAVVYENGSEVGRVAKQLLPTYDVFDEYRYFEPAEPQTPVEWRGPQAGPARLRGHVE